MTADKERHLVKHETDSFLAELHTKYGERFRQYREDWDKASLQEYVPDFPLHLELEVTNYCNLKCKICHFAKYQHAPQDRKNIPLEYVDEILDQCKGRLPAVLIGSGAESLLHPQIRDIILKFRQAEIMDIILSTNGVLLDRDLSKLVIELPVARVTISLDAVTPETYSIVRGGNFKKVEANVLTLLEERDKAGASLPYLRLSFVMQEENKHEADAFREKWLGKADRIDFQQLMTIRGETPEEALIGVEPTNTCAHPFQRLTIDYNGDIFPCCTYYKRFLKLGNIKEDSIESIWHGEKIQKLRQSLINGDLNKACRACLSY